MPFTYHDGNTVLAHRSVDGVGFGKVAIVSGCASGIGLATTQLLLSHQFQVLGVDINEMDYAQVDQRDQERFHFHRADLMGEGECDEVVRICVAEFGERIDVLANVAGIMDAFAAADVYTDKEWDHIMAVNLTVPLRLIRAVLPIMKARKNGSIINVASKAGISGASAGVAYTASKHGLLGITKNTAWRFRDEGIRCNAVLPGATATNINSSMEQDNFDTEAFSHYSPVIALHHDMSKGQPPAITPAEVANAILFLASDQAKMINGISLPVDRAWGVI